MSKIRKNYEKVFVEVLAEALRQPKKCHEFF